MEKENYPLHSADAERPSQEEASNFDLFGEEAQDDYVKAILAEAEKEESEISEAKKMPEAKEDQSY